MKQNNKDDSAKYKHGWVESWRCPSCGALNKLHYCVACKVDKGVTVVMTRRK